MIERISIVIFFSGEIERERKETSSIDQDTRQMQLDMTRLSSLISEKQGKQRNLEQDSLLRENDFVAALKVKWNAGQLSCRKNICHLSRFLSKTLFSIFNEFVAAVKRRWHPDRWSCRKKYLSPLFFIFSNNYFHFSRLESWRIFFQPLHRFCTIYMYMCLPSPFEISKKNTCVCTSSCNPSWKHKFWSARSWFLFFFWVLPMKQIKLFLSESF